VCRVVTGDKILILLSFTNNTAVPQSFGRTPSFPVTFTDWGGYRSVEMTLGRRQPKKKSVDDEALALLLDAEPWKCTTTVGPGAA
jgi:hypothetical protein